MPLETAGRPETILPYRPVNPAKNLLATGHLALAPQGVVWHYCAMHNLDQFLASIDAYCRAAGITPETLCRRATNNPRLLPRLLRRSELLASDVERIERHMAANPIGKSEVV